LVATVRTVASTHCPRAYARRECQVDVLDLRIGRRRDGAAVTADERQSGAQDHLAFVDARAAGSQLTSHRHPCEVLDAHRNPAAGGDADVTDLVKALDPAGGAHNVAFAVALDVIGAAARIVGFDRIDDLAESNAIADETSRIGLDPVLLDIAADGVGAGNAGDGLHLWPYDPVLDRAQIDEALQIVGEALALGREIGAVALPNRARRRLRPGRPRAERIPPTTNRLRQVPWRSAPCSRRHSAADLAVPRSGVPSPAGARSRCRSGR
jgi:hypothetical protein